MEGLEGPCVEGLEGLLSGCLQATLVRFATTHLEGSSCALSGVLHLNLLHTRQSPELTAHAVVAFWAVASCHRALVAGEATWVERSRFPVVTSSQALVAVLSVAPFWGYALILALPRHLEVAHSLLLQLKQPKQGRNVFECRFEPVVVVVP